MNFLLFLTSTITQPPAEGATQAANNTAQMTGAGGPMTIISFVLYIAFIFGVMWLLVIRPQKKRDKKHREMISNIKAGDSVVTNTGFYGKVVDITEGCFIIEFGTNKAIRIPVERSEVAGIREPNLTVKRYDSPELSDSEEKK